MFRPSYEGRLFVFAQPEKFDFVLPDESTHKQVLTLHNPNDFPIDYIFLSNSPSKYKIPHPCGFLRARHKIDIVVRHNFPVPMNVGTIDTLRVKICEKGNKDRFGIQDIPLRLLKEPEVRLPIRDQFHDFPKERHRSLPPPVQQNIDNRQVKDLTSLNTALIFFCGFILFILPTEGTEDSDSWFPRRFHVSSEIKMYFSFTLGFLLGRVYSGT